MIMMIRVNNNDNQDNFLEVHCLVNNLQFYDHFIMKCHNR